MKQLLVFGVKTFKITVPDGAKITFGPFSPPTKGQQWSEDRAKGTLRIYAEGNEKDIIACFAGVSGFRDLSLGYAEEIAREEGAVIWKDDKDGYRREEKVQRASDWVNPTPALEAPAKGRRKPRH